MHLHINVRKITGTEKKTENELQIWIKVFFSDFVVIRLPHRAASIKRIKSNNILNTVVGWLHLRSEYERKFNFARIRFDERVCSNYLIKYSCYIALVNRRENLKLYIHDKQSDGITFLITRYKQISLNCMFTRAIFVRFCFFFFFGSYNFIATYHTDIEFQWEK